MSQEVYERIKDDLKIAMKSGDAEAVSTFRMLISALDNERISNKGTLTPEDTITVLNREAKKRREASESYYEGGREELANKEAREEELILEYLPAQLTEGEIEQIVSETIDDLGAVDKSAFGRVMGQVMGQVHGKADGNVVRRIVEEKLE